MHADDPLRFRMFFYTNSVVRTSIVYRRIFPYFNLAECEETDKKKKKQTIPFVRRRTVTRHVRATDIAPTAAADSRDVLFV